MFCPFAGLKKSQRADANPAKQISNPESSWDAATCGFWHFLCLSQLAEYLREESTMAHSPIKLENSGSRPLNSSARRSSSPAKGSSFARVMEDTSASAAKNDAVSANASRATSKKGMPRVARLPESRGIPLQNQNPVLAGRTPSDMLRMQNFQKAQGDIVRTRTMGRTDGFHGHKQSVNAGYSTQCPYGPHGWAISLPQPVTDAASPLTAADYILTAPLSA